MEQFKTTESLASTREAPEYESGAGRNSTFDNIKDKVAGGLKTAAESLRPEGRQQGAMSDYANQASGWLDSAGEYVRDMDVSQVKTDIQRQMRANPGRSLLIAGAAGLILGALIRRR